MPAADHIGVPVCRRGTQPGGGARPAEAVRLRLHQSPAAQPSPGAHARQASELPGDAGLGGLGTGRIADAHPQDRIALAGVIRETETVTAGGSPVYRCVLADGSGDLDVLFLGRAAVAGLTVGTRCRIQGTVTRRGGRLAVWNPRYQLEPRMHGARGGVASEPARPESAEPPILAELAGTGVAATADAADVIADGVKAAAHFRIYLGVAAGAGKTIAMLDEGHRRRAGGADVVIAFLETHGRPVTESRIGGLEIVPRRVVDYRGNRFEEMDIDAVLRRRPQVALVDELAHTNVPGSGRHTKRWQDVLELLDAEIDVVATVNIQHLESIADIAEAITGVRISERVPDWVVRQADQIELVDSSPEQLRTMALNERERPLAARALAGVEPKSMMANDLSARLARKASAGLTDTDRELVDLSGPERKLIRRALRHGLGLDPGNPNLIAAWNPAAHPRAPAGGATGGQFAPGGTGPAPTNAAPVQQGQSGAQVRQLQERLNALGAHLAVDGKFGPATLAAVRAVQRGHKDAQGRQLKVDGLVGPLTTSARRLKPAPARKTAAPKTTPKKTTTVKPPPGASGKNVPVTYAHAAGRPGDDVLAFRFRHGWIKIGGPDGKGGKRERSPLIPEGLAPLEPQRVAERRMRKQAERWQRQSAPAKPVPPLRHPLIPEGLAPLEPGGKDRHGWVKLLEDKHAAEHAAGKTDHPRLHRAMARIKRRR